MLHSQWGSQPGRSATYWGNLASHALPFGTHSKQVLPSPSLSGLRPLRFPFPTPTQIQFSTQLQHLLSEPFQQVPFVTHPPQNHPFLPPLNPPERLAFPSARCVVIARTKSLSLTPRASLISLYWDITEAIWCIPEPVQLVLILSSLGIGYGLFQCGGGPAALRSHGTFLPPVRS